MYFCMVIMACSVEELPLELKAIALDENRHVTFEYACKSDQVSGYKGDL